MTAPQASLGFLAPWMARQRWFANKGALPALEEIGSWSYPSGEPGVQVVTHLLLDHTEGKPALYQVPLTYRDAPLVGADAYLVGTTEHSVLGTRWVYDGTADPVWAAALATAVLTGGTQAEAWFEVDGERQVREPNSTVVGSGSPGTPVPDVDRLTVDQVEGRTVVTGAAVRIVVARVLGRHDAGALASTGGHTGDHGVEVLTGTWTGHDQPETLAVVLTA